MSDYLHAFEIAKEVLGDGHSDSYYNDIIWEHTGFPSFWDSKNGETIEDCFRRQLLDFKNGKGDKTK